MTVKNKPEVRASVQVIGWVKGTKSDDEARKAFKEHLNSTGLRKAIENTGLELDDLSIECDMDDETEIIASFGGEE